MKIKVRKNKSVVFVAETEADNQAMIEFLDNLTGQVKHPNPAGLIKRLEALRSESPWRDGHGY